MKIPVFMQACPAAVHFESASGCFDPSCLQCAMAPEHVSAEAGKAKATNEKTAIVSIRMGANPGCVAIEASYQNAAPGEISYFAGGRSGLSAHFRAVGSRSRSSPQPVQTYRSFPPAISSGTAVIGRPHAGHAFRTG
ncbi:hypothetical protein ABIB75_007483 [Bradyrhizobium sp. GM2.2]|uniref:hypothetical protein n=1 Tax=Bradyrhizobium sp. GM2.2 TaxID=3156358 RepID=UPI0033918BBB